MPRRLRAKDCEIIRAFMHKEGRGMEDVPEEGGRVSLCSGMTLSTGGTAKDVTDDVHPSVRSLCERAERISGMDVCGIDLIVKDVLGPDGGGGGVIEVNAEPGRRRQRRRRHHPHEPSRHQGG